MAIKKVRSDALFNNVVVAKTKDLELPIRSLRFTPKITENAFLMIVMLTILLVFTALVMILTAFLVLPLVVVMAGLIAIATKFDGCRLLVRHAIAVRQTAPQQRMRCEGDDGQYAKHGCHVDRNLRFTRQDRNWMNWVYSRNWNGLKLAQSPATQRVPQCGSVEDNRSTMH